MLLGTPWSRAIRTSADLQLLLEQTHTIHDLERISPRNQKAAPLAIEAAAASFGDVNLVSVLGSPLTLDVDPKFPLCTLALPSHGWGQYRMDGQSVDNTVGVSVAFLPPRGWRLTNDQTGGTAVQFTEDSLLARVASIDPLHNLAVAAAQLSLPTSISTHRDPALRFYRHLLGALAMVDSSYRHGQGEPDPMLRLDDLILRCVACLLFPGLARPDSQDPPQLSAGDRRRTVMALMDWMGANLHQPISLSEIEQRSHYGRRAIQLAFKAEVGCGPMQWLRRQRLQAAYQQLQHPGPGLTVTQVARACGYLNLASFSRDFRDRFGIAASLLLRQSSHQCNRFESP